MGEGPVGHSRLCRSHPSLSSHLWLLAVAIGAPSASDPCPAASCTAWAAHWARELDSSQPDSSALGRMVSNNVRGEVFEMIEGGNRG